jgi:hypothetical protein
MSEKQILEALENNNWDIIIEYLDEWIERLKYGGEL